MLNSSERKALRAKAHHLKPVVALGQKGLTPAVLASIDEALTAHELIKVRLRGVLREDKEATVEAIAGPLAAEAVGLIGSILILYRQNPEE